MDCGPHVGDDIAFGPCVRGAYQSDAGGEFRQRQLAVRVEQALALELHAQLVDLLLQSAAGADLADVVADEAQPRLLDPDVGLAMHDHAVALLE